jgi:hypothetical protein
LVQVDQQIKFRFNSKKARMAKSAKQPTFPAFCFRSPLFFQSFHGSEAMIAVAQAWRPLDRRWWRRMKRRPWSTLGGKFDGDVQPGVRGSNENMKCGGETAIHDALSSKLTMRKVWYE